VISTVLAAMVLAGCAGMFARTSQRHHRSSSLVEFLYAGQAPPARDAVPLLELPLTVGIAFLPSAPRTGPLDEAEKNGVLERVRERFGSRAFVRDIVPIPDYYLAWQPGFDGLASLQRLYDLDLVALVSYDQVSRQEGNELSLAYLTIVGAYLLPGTSQDVSTMVDLAVVDPSSRSLVLRAAGMDSRQGASTDVAANQRLRARGIDSFHAASDQMIERFGAELVRFEQSVRNGTARVRISNRSGSNQGGGGGGSAGMFALALLGVAAAATARRRIRARQRADGR
jgi:rhombotail lipoprotein